LGGFAVPRSQPRQVSGDVGQVSVQVAGGKDIGVVPKRYRFAKIK
jgi:hypothetical protein